MPAIAAVAVMAMMTRLPSHHVPSSVPSPVAPDVASLVVTLVVMVVAVMLVAVNATGTVAGIARSPRTACCFNHLESRSWQERLLTAERLNLGSSPPSGRCLAFPVTAKPVNVKGLYTVHFRK